MLIGARVVQGVGAALMNPSTLSIITVTFPPRQRGAAIGIWAGVSALALAIGPLVGGLITEHVNWNWIFFINVPVGALAVVAAFLFIDESRDTSREQRPDLPGLITSALALFALSYGLIEANNYGWTSTRILLAFGIAAVALVVFVLLELRQRLPMLDLSLFKSRGFAGANAVMLFLALAMFGVFFYVSLYVQQVLGYSPVQAGAAFLPWTILIMFVAPVAGKLSDRIGARPIVTERARARWRARCSGSRTSECSESFWALLPGMLLGGLGMAARDGADDGGGDALRRAGQGGRRLGRAEQRAPGRRLARHRAHGCDRDLRDDELARGRRSAQTSPSRTASITRSRSPRRSSSSGRSIAFATLHHVRTTRSQERHRVRRGR